MRTKILGAILFAVPTAVLVTTQASESAAPECSTKPGASTPAGRHWYYRINHASKQQCWYLGAENQRVHEHRARLLESTSRSSARPTQIQQTDVAEPAAMPAQTVRAALLPVRTAPAQAAPADAAANAAPTDGTGGWIAFAERWPDLPDVKNSDGSDLNALSSSYANTEAARDATAQMPAKWPVIEAGPEGAPTASGLQSLPLAGPLGVALLLLAGATFDLAIAPQRSRFRRVWRAIVTPRQPRARARRMTAHASAAGMDEARSGRPPTLTDPALDLKRSLAELMRALQRAGIACEPPRSFAPAAAAGRDHAHRQLRARRLSTRLENLRRHSPPGRSAFATRRV